MNYHNLSTVLKYAETTEDDFHKLLDTNPHDHNTRLVFADWLQEHNDPRAEGYRALGKLQVRPNLLISDIGPQYTHMNNIRILDEWSDHERYKQHALPTDWFDLVQVPPAGRNDAWKGGFTDRRHAEDAAAHAFAQLPQERREELLK